jgi:hypothetical protein
VQDDDKVTVTELSFEIAMDSLPDDMPEGKDRPAVETDWRGLYEVQQDVVHDFIYDTYEREEKQSRKHFRWGLVIGALAGAAVTYLVPTL